MLGDMDRCVKYAGRVANTERAVKSSALQRFKSFFSACSQASEHSEQLRRRDGKHVFLKMSRLLFG